MFLLSGPQREGGEKKRERESASGPRQRETGMKWPFFSLLKSVSASEMIRDRALRPSRPGPFYLCRFLLRGPVSAAMSSSPGRKTVVEEEEGHELRWGAPAKTRLLRFHSLETKPTNMCFGDACGWSCRAASCRK